MLRWEKAEGGGKEERILVSVRLRPLNAKEIERNDPADWECINNTTIIFKQSLPERSLYPSAYTFDRVFGYQRSTRHVYDEGAKEVALSVVSGINASIFAYGQTSSGKTYTMTGITEYTVEDIYDYIKRHEERQFVLKFSAMEIYNEAVRDLLSTDTTPLRLLDDPERGTVVERLTEETLRDERHLKELISICAAQRQVGETVLNEMSSRSHQILRLTIESTARQFMGKDISSTLFAAVNFIDLAGSERASQVASAGNRLKEGCHINRSLLTLGTVIRKLSKGRTGHIPYRDSKLTRILQPYLGGNGRTAIICTMSPARSHIEQSRNTLLFASCAKQVVTDAQVNVVMSDKALVKHLQKELAKLENELRYPPSASCLHSDVLRDKEAQIKKMEREIRELMQQRDLAHSRLEDLLRAVVDEQASRWEESSQSSVSHVRSECEDALSVSGVSGTAYQIPENDSSRFDLPEESNMSDNDHQELSDKTDPPRRSNSNHTLNIPIPQQGMEETVEVTYEDSEAHCKEVQCIEIHDNNLLLNVKSDGLLPQTDEDKLGDPAPQSAGNAHLSPAIEQSIDSATKRTTDDFVQSCPEGSSPLLSVQNLMDSRELALTRSTSCKASLMNSSILFWLESVEQDEKRPPEKPEGVHRRLFSMPHYDIDKETLSVEGSQAPEKLTSSDRLKTEVTKTVSGEVDPNVSAKFSAMKEMNGSHHQRHLSSDQETRQTQLEPHGAEKNVKRVGVDAARCSMDSPSRWQIEFERKQQEIIELWHACYVPLVHRTCFFLLFKGDRADSFYMEVECRRLYFLRNTFTRVDAGDLGVEDGHRSSLSSSLKYLRREREMLCKKMQKKLSLGERESLYAEWGVALNSKQRRLQVAQLLWTKTDLEHVKQSASLVAKLIGFVEQGHATKEMFRLSFTPQTTHKRSFSWMPSLM